MYENNFSDVKNFYTYSMEDKLEDKLSVPLNVHQQNCGTIYAVCATGNIN